MLQGKYRRVSLFWIFKIQSRSVKSEWWAFWFWATWFDPWKSHSSLQVTWGRFIILSSINSGSLLSSVFLAIIRISGILVRVSKTKKCNQSDILKNVSKCQDRNLLSLNRKKILSWHFKFNNRFPLWFLPVITHSFDFCRGIGCHSDAIRVFSLGIPLQESGCMSEPFRC